MKKDHIANVALAVVLLILASIMFMSFRQMNHLSDYERRENFTFDIIQGLDRLLAAVRDVRADQRSFTKSGDDRYLKPYHEALKEVEGRLASLGRLKAGNPWLERRLAAIDPLVRKKLDESAQQMEHSAGKEAASPPDGSAAAAGHVGMGEIRREVSAAQDEAVRLMRALSETQQADFRQMQRLLVIDSMAIFLLVSLVFRLLRKEIARRAASEQELIRHRDHLEELVRDRTRGLELANQELCAEITERRRIEAALQQKERTYRSLFENSLDAVLITTPDGEITSANAAAARAFGRTQEELIGIGLNGIVDPGDPRLAGVLEKQAQGSFLFELDFRRKDGSLFPAEASFALVADGADSFLMIHDISERKWAEKVRRNLVEHEHSIQEQERLSLSRQVHDEMGQNLTALKLDLSWIEHRFPAGGEDLAGRLKEMRTALDQLILKAQQITAELRPPLLDNLGLAAALEWQADAFKRRSGIECHLMLNEGIDIESRQTATMVLRIFQEAMTNILRHARASEVSISLCQRDDLIILEISDDGCGITLNDLDSPTAYGIMGMRERASLCQGGLSITGKPGQGTTVSLAISRLAAKEF